MDNNKDNMSSFKKDLDAENQEWLAQLLNETDATQEQETTSDSRDAQLERILMENWTGNDVAPVIPEDATHEDDTFGDDFDFDALLAADTITEEPQPAPAPAEVPAPVENPSPAQMPALEPEIFADEPNIFADGQEEAKAPEEVETPQKGRPKRQSGYGLFGIPHIVSTLIWLALILAIGVSLGRTLWVCCADVMAFGKEAKTVSITVTEDDDIDSIATKLGNADLVRYPSLFKFFANVTG